MHHKQYWKYVPAICDQVVIVKRFRENLRHIGVQALRQAVDMDLLGPSIGEDYIFVVANCDGCRIEKTKFIAEPSLRPINKPRAFLEGWSTDLITNI